MKKTLSALIGITIIMLFIAAECALAFRCGGGRGVGGYGCWGSGWNRFSFEGIPNLTAEQSQKLAQLQKAHIEETSALRTALAVKALELDQFLAQPRAQKDEALKLQKEISALRAQLEQQCLTRHIELGTILTDEQRTQLPYGPGTRGRGPSGWMREPGLPPGQGYGPGGPGLYRGGWGGCGPCCW